MKSIRRSYAALLAIFTLAWLIADGASLGVASGLIAWRNLLVQYTGVLAMACMSVGVILANRPAWLEGKLDGLDKMYRLHKWLGVTGLCLAVLHWVATQGPKWLTALGLFQRGPRGPRPEITVEIFQFFQSQRHNAEELGEKAFYVAVVLILIALIRYFPYRHFFRTHRWLSVAYLVLVWHSVVLLNYPYWTTPLGPLMALLMAAGTVAAVASLFRRIGAQRRVLGIVEKTGFFDGVNVNAIEVRLRNAWPGHEAGQFAFVSFDRKEGAHPFTISSAWQDDGRLRFLIKELGDYTRTLAGRIQPGHAVTVEGPYGRFHFDDEGARQIWIGAGIGITPFVARMQALARQKDGRRIDLFHTTQGVDAAALDHLRADAAAAGVNLHLVLTATEARLDGAKLRATLPDWQDASIWFCGPAEFGAALRADLLAHGLPAARFHQELFEMR